MEFGANYEGRRIFIPGAEVEFFTVAASEHEKLVAEPSARFTQVVKNVLKDQTTVG